MDNTEILRHIIEIKENQAGMKSDISNMRTDILSYREEVVKDVKPRVDKLEKKATWAAGAASASGFIGGLIGWFTSHILKAT